jgi:hypothetical protein
MLNGEVGVPYTLILHILNADPIVGEVDELPTRTDTMVMITNPRTRDGKDVHFLDENVITIMFPVEKLNFIEVLSEKEHEEIIGFVRE